MERFDNCVSNRHRNTHPTSPLSTALCNHLYSSAHIFTHCAQLKGHDANPVFKKLSGLGDESEREEEAETAEEEPPASILVRRQALVPPKLITDDYESANEDIDNGLSGSPGIRRSDSLESAAHHAGTMSDGGGHGRSSRASNDAHSSSPGANRHSPNL